MKIAVIGGTSTDENPQTDYKTPLEQNINDVEFVEIRFDYLVFEITPSKFEVYDWRTKTPLSEYDCIMFRGKIRENTECAYVISKYGAHKNITFFNDYSDYRPSSKLAQSVEFFEIGVSFLPTYYALNNEYLIEATDKFLPFPLIVKDSLGSHGNNNFVAKDKSELESIITINKDVHFVTQGFCPNDCDYRILIIGNDKPLIIKRTAAQGTHLNNTSQGGAAELKSELPVSVITDAQKIANRFKMTIAGVDALQNKDTGEYFFLEVNSQPQLVTGAFVSEKIELLKNFLSK